MSASAERVCSILDPLRVAAGRAYQGEKVRRLRGVTVLQGEKVVCAREKKYLLKKMVRRSLSHVKSIALFDSI